MSSPGFPIHSRVDAAALASIPFSDPVSANQRLQHAAARLSTTLAATLPALLSENPDPDSALILFDRLLTESSGELSRLLDRHPFLAHYALVVFGHSRFLAETLLRNLDLFPAFLREKNLDRSFSREDFQEALARFRSRSFETDISLLLARFKRREYVRILLRDVLRIAPLAETTAEISALSDVLIEDALRHADSQLQYKYGLPQHVDERARLANTSFAVLSLGKLGGNELNYSSDVDLMYIYGSGDEPAGASISNHEYFIRLAQLVTDILAKVTPEGPVFRIDLRLRPQGHEGELAISLAQASRYYSQTAHDWELQALIKVRCSAGNSALAREFIRAVQPHVYGQVVNFAAIKTALVSREKMHARRRPSPGTRTLDVKLDPGGIRDIEFLVQCLQRVYGGAEPWLRSGGTLFSLQKLHDKGHLSGKEFHDLSTTYEFLRHLEHRLQLRMGQQTHRLPAGPADCEILRRSLAHLPSVDDCPTGIVSALQRHMSAVAEIYQRVIFQQQARSERDLPESSFQLRSLPGPGTAEHSNQQILARLAQDAPTIHARLQRDDLLPHTRKNFFRFLASALTSSERYATVLRHADAVGRALPLFEISDYVTELLVRHPQEIVGLSQLDSDAAQRPSGYLFGGPFNSGSASADPIFEFVATSSTPYAEKLALLRQQYRHRIFSSVSRDILDLSNVYESLSAATAVAEDAIRTALALSVPPPGLAVMALGRLGTGEFDVLSDADLLFVCEEGQDHAAARKAVEQVMQALSAYTRDGTVFPVDTRLRPHGAAGELLITPAQLGSYFRQEAQPWEALIHTKLRLIAGSQYVASRAQAAARELFQRFSADPQFARAVREMRTRLETGEDGRKNFKTAPGGAYDIDFLVSYLLIRSNARSTGGTLRHRLWRCAAEGLLQKSDAARLDHAAELLRTLEHVVRLVVGRARKWFPATGQARQSVEKLSSGILRREFPRGLELELETTMQETRQIYERLLSSPQNPDRPARVPAG